MKRSSLENIPKALRTIVEDRDNTTPFPTMTTCIYCGVEMDRKEGKYHIAHYHTRNTHDDMREDNLVVLCSKCHTMQHTDLLSERRIKERMKNYLSSKYPNGKY